MNIRDYPVNIRDYPVNIPSSPRRPIFRSRSHHQPFDPAGEIEPDHLVHFAPGGSSLTIWRILTRREWGFSILIPPGHFHPSYLVLILLRESRWMKSPSGSNGEDAVWIFDSYNKGCVELGAENDAPNIGGSS